MPPIPVYSDSPVAAKPSEATPETSVQAPVAPQNNVVPATTTASPTQSQPSYPQALPGAGPSLPTPAAAAPAPASYMLPTPTQDMREDGPPPPQPGAVPQPSGMRGHLPPPPKAGEKYVPPSTTAYPPQMSYPPPTMAYPAQQYGTSAAATSSTYGGQAARGFPDQSLQHPPGYQQNANASGLDSYQISAIQRDDARNPLQNGSEAEEGVWNSAKKWAQATGEKLAAVETEVWKKINKG